MTEPTMLTRTAILEAKDITTETVLCPEWGGAVRIRAMTSNERQAFTKFIERPIDIDELDISRSEKRRMKRAGVKPTGTKDEELAELIVYWSCVNEDGSRMFEEEDIPKLREKAAAPINRIVDAVSRLSGFTDDDIEDLASRMVGDDAPLASNTSC